MVIVVFTFLFMDLFDSVGFLVGVAAKGNLIDENGNIVEGTLSFFQTILDAYLDFSNKLTE